MRLVFMGTPEFAVPSLDMLLKNDEEVVMVVTQPDKPKGRGHKVAFSPVKEYALKEGIPVMQPEKIGSEASVEQLKSLRADLFITCAFGQFLTPEVLDIPPMGTVNVHGSLLPKYRGAAPIHWAIINGEKKTGITTMMTVLKLDAGDILLQREIEIDNTMTAGQLHDRMSLLGGITLVETLEGFKAGTIDPIPQKACETCYAPRITKDTGRIDWTASAEDIHNLIRGTNPWPGAWSFYKQECIRIWKSERVQDGIKSGKQPGTILDITKAGFQVQTGNGVLLISELQCANARRLTVEQYICGHVVCVGDCFGTE